MTDQPELFSEQELADAFTRVRKCRKCKRKLHVDRQEQYKTRVAGLCYACMREFETSNHWSIETFLNPVTDEEQKAVEEFEATVTEFLELLDSPPLIAFRTKAKHDPDRNEPE